MKTLCMFACALILSGSAGSVTLYQPGHGPGTYGNGLGVYR